MDIYILRDGQETGPYSEENTAALLEQGEVQSADFAWRPGMPEWLPLSELLEVPGEEAAEAADSAALEEPATDKQKAFLSYFGVSFPEKLAKQAASLLVNDVMEDSKNSARLSRWNEDRLTLHPQLFAAELQVLKGNRAEQYFEVCQSEGAEYFTKVTKAHCQVLVAYLDREFPNWDAHPAEAAEKYFYPAVAKKFPQLVTKEGRSLLSSSTGSAPASKSTSKVATSRLKKTPVRPVMALARGLFIGALLLGAAIFIVEKRKSPASTAGAVVTTAAATATSNVTPTAPAVAAESLPETPRMEAEPAAEAAPPAAKPDPAVSPSAPDPAAMAVAEAPAPAAEAATPAANSIPLFNPEPAASPAPPASVAPAAPAAKTNLVLTKPFEAQLAYGKMKLPAGTALKLIARENAALRVSYQNTLLIVPASSTDIDSDAPPAPAPPATDL